MFFGVIGDSIRVSASVDDWPEELPAEALARHFLEALARSYPAYAGRWVAHPDMKEHHYPAYQAECGGTRSFGSIARALKRITPKREREYRDRRSGKRRTVTEYLVPRPAAEVVEFAEEKRRRA